MMCFFFFQAEDGIRDYKVTGVQTCALPISFAGRSRSRSLRVDVPRRRLFSICWNEAARSTVSRRDRCPVWDWRSGWTLPRPSTALHLQLQHLSRILMERPLATAHGVIARCKSLAECTSESGFTTRPFLSEPMREVHLRLGAWMQQAGMSVSIDAVGNLRGGYAAQQPSAPRLFIGSHLDTVPARVRMTAFLASFWESRWSN